MLTLVVKKGIVELYIFCLPLFSFWGKRGGEGGELM